MRGKQGRGPHRDAAPSWAVLGSSPWRRLPCTAILMFFLSGCFGTGDWIAGDDDSPLPPPLAADAKGVVADNTGRGKAAKTRPLANSLITDKEKAKHSDEELRGGRVAAVAPPRLGTAPARATADATPPAMPQVAAADVTAAPIPGAIQVSPAALGALPSGAYSGATFQPSQAQPLPPDLIASLPPGVAERYQESMGAAGVPGFSGEAFTTIPFASGSTRLNGADLRAIGMAADTYLASRRGRIRVVGHASRTPSSRPASEQMIASWEISQSRANVVADALIGRGVPAGAIVIEAVGDGQLAMAEPDVVSEASERRVDIYLE